MRNLILIVILAVAGYFAYQYYVETFLHESSEISNNAGEASSEYLPPVPQQCEDQGKTLEDAIYGHELGKLTVVELNQYTRRFQACLKDAGFTNSQINRTYDEIRERALSTDPSDLRGWTPKE